MNDALPVAIIGAGPVGLAAAAHLARRGRRLIVLEAGPAIASAVRQWSHVRMFSPWRYNVDAAARALLEAAGWAAPNPEDVPTGGDLVRQYLDPLAALPALAPHIRLGARVVSVGRKDFDKVQTKGRTEQPFEIRIATAAGPETIEAAAVIDASGTWARPNPIGSGGLPAAGEVELTDRIAYGIPDVLGAVRADYAGRTTMVVGAGHSAINVLLELIELQEAEPATRILWATRRDDIESAFGGGAADALPARGELGERARRAVAEGQVEVVSPLRVSGFARLPNGKLRVTGRMRGQEISVEVDRVVGATGFRPDFAPLSEVRLELDPWLESARALGPLIDPNLHSCGTVRPHGARELAHPEQDFYIAGMKSYGRAPTFLLATGHEQVRSIVAALSGDAAGAARVELELPETGVCSATPKAAKTAAGASAGCCGGPPAADVPAELEACCADDAKAKQAGKSGCGSKAKRAEPAQAAAVPQAASAPAAKGCCGGGAGKARQPAETEAGGGT